MEKKLFGRKRPFSPLLALILLLYLCVTVGYSLINPLFETPDEHFHFFTINEIANSGKLPVVPAIYDPYLGPEPAQPPLFYLLSALITAPFDTADARQQVQLNPFSWIGSAEAVVNINRTIVSEAELWPWQGYAIPAHLIRFFSTVLGLGTLLSVYGNGRFLWPNDEKPALLATAFVAFLPQFNFIHSAITNDTMITFLASFAIWQLLRLWFTAVSPQKLLLLGSTIGLAALSKNAGVLLLLYALGVLFLLTLRDLDLSKSWQAQARRRLGETAVYIILPTLLIAGWLLVRNQILYGDLTAVNQFVEIAGGDRGYSLRQVLAETDGLWLSFFAVFGWFNVRPPEWIYTVWNSLALLAGLGLLLGSGKTVAALRWPKLSHWFTNIQQLLKQPWVVGVILFIWAVGVYAGLVTFMLQTEAAQGRLLFPAIVPIALAFAYGWMALINSVAFLRKQAWPLVAIVALSAFITTIYCLFFVIQPAYALPKWVDGLPEGATVLNEPMPFGVTLVGAEVETKTAVSQDLVTYTLYWQIDQPVTELPAFKFEILGRDLENPLGEIHTFHGRGQYPPTVWPTNQLIADRFAVRLDNVQDAPVLANGFARLVPLDDTAESDTQAGIGVGAVKVVPEQWPVDNGERLATLGELIELAEVVVSKTAVQPNDTVQINIRWRVIGTPATDYATLVHLAPPNEPPLAQGDAHPLNGTYPTRVWEAGEIINDQYQLTIPPDLAEGCYPLWLGMYTPDSFERLPLTIDGTRQPNDAYQAAELCVIP